MFICYLIFVYIGIVNFYIYGIIIKRVRIIWDLDRFYFLDWKLVILCSVIVVVICVVGIVFVCRCVLKRNILLRLKFKVILIKGREMIVFYLFVNYKI